MTVYIPDGESSIENKIYQHSENKSQVGLNVIEDIGLWIKDNSTPVDPDEGSMSIDFFKYDENKNPIFIRTDIPTVLETGLIVSKLMPSETSEVGQIKAVWKYSYDGNNYEYDDYFVIYGYMPDYESLRESEKVIIKEVKWLFEDLYDSVNGGPHLQEEFQTAFNLNRYAQLLRHAVYNINLSSQPMTNYGVGEGNGGAFPSAFYNLLTKALYVEVLKHFVRTYVEQPNVNGGPGVAYLDRKDYMSRWQQILTTEQAELKDAIKVFKFSLMGLGGGNLLVSGGIFGNAGNFAGGMYTAALRGARFWPQSNIIQRM